MFRQTSIDSIFYSIPLPSIDSIINEVAKWKCISTLDWISAYHQKKVRPENRSYTAFQSGSELYQREVLSFGLTNAVPAFQRLMNVFIKKIQLNRINVCLDNLTVGGEDQQSHHPNLKALKQAALTLVYTNHNCKLSGASRFFILL